MKIYQSILNSRLTTFLEKTEYFHDEQSGFRKNRSIMDCHLILKEIWNSRKHKIGLRGGKNKTDPLFLAFLDLRKAFDKVPRALLWQKLRDAGVPDSFLNRIRDQFSNIRGKVRIGELLTNEFDIASGVVQGSRLGPILFDIFLNDLLGDLKKKSKGVAIANDIKVHCLAYADDLCLIAENEIELQNMLEICSKWAIKNGMAFNPKKSEVLIHPKNNFTVKKRHSFETYFKIGKGLISVKPVVKYLRIFVKGSTKPYSEFLKITLEKATKRLTLNSIARI